MLPPLAFTHIEKLETPHHPSLLLPLLREESHLVLLDSSNPSQGRFSFLGVDPLFGLVAKDGECFFGPHGKLVKKQDTPLAVLRKLLAPRSTTPTHLPIPFYFGAMGFLSYELLHWLERVPRIAGNDFPVPDLSLYFFGTVYVHDAEENISWLCVTGTGESDAQALFAQEALLQKNRERLRNISPSNKISFQERAQEIRQKKPQFLEAHFSEFQLRPTFGASQYFDVVQRARNHILAGDIFEVCTSQRFSTTCEASGETLFQILREISPAGFGAYLRMEDLEVISSSPERFVRLSEEGWAQTEPIKGTRPRGATPEEDARLREDLQHSEKDLAENVMIVDLARNDLGRVCEFGTVRVPHLQEVKTYAFTHQMVSTVVGKLRPECDAVDLLQAAFPGGSISGAPKIEAMKIVNELEPVPRGIFCGSLGYIGRNHAMDFNIAIRTLVKRGNSVQFHVGGAITADSSPQEEYQETLDKAYGMAIALKLAREV